MSGDVTYQSLKRLTWLPERDASDNGNVIAGQEYDNVYFNGGAINNATLTNCTIVGSSSPKSFSGGYKVALAGDSITRQVNDIAYSAGSNSRLNDEALGYIGWLQFYSRFAFDYELTIGAYDFPAQTIDPVTSGNFGISGNNTTQLLARIQDVVDYAPDICFLCIGTNDISSTSTSYATITSNMTGIVNALTNAGILVVWTPITPRSYWGALTAGEIVTRRNVMMRVNDFIRQFPYTNSNPQVIVCDTWPEMCDSTSADGDPIAGILQTGDNLHFAPKGGQIWGRELWDLLQTIIPPRPNRLPVSQRDVYQATENPTGNLLTNGLLTGTAGSKGTDVSGNVATSMIASRSASAGTFLVVASKGGTSMDGTPGTYQRFVITGNGAGDADDSLTLKQTVDITTNFAAGDIIEAGCNAAWTGVTGTFREMKLGMEIYDSVAGQYTISFLDQFSNTDPFPNADASGMFKTQPFQIPATATGLNLRVTIRFDNTGACGGTFDIGNMFIRKVV